MNTARHVGPPEQPADNTTESLSAAAEASQVTDAIRTTAREVFEDLSTNSDVIMFIAAALILAGTVDSDGEACLFYVHHSDGSTFVNVGTALGCADSFAESCAEVLEQLDEQHAASLSDEASS